MRRGIVSGRVALLPRSTEIQPLSHRFVPPPLQNFKDVRRVPEVYSSVANLGDSCPGRCMSRCCQCPGRCMRRCCQRPSRCLCRCCRCPGRCPCRCMSRCCQRPGRCLGRCCQRPSRCPCRCCQRPSRCCQHPG